MLYLTLYANLWLTAVLKMKNLWIKKELSLLSDLSTVTAQQMSNIL